ncbi:hypothetical protein BC832DRAFT_75269 [Gaertneriomyces semiglobifer]|nr:hypothetical protein BC832DRAFT_75269 [Gaertneriomyces semiglobifer]
MRRVEENVKSLQKELENGRERERTLKERLEEREKECAVLRIYAGRRASNGTVLQPTDGTEAAANDTRRVPLGRKRVVSYPVGGKHAVRRGISKMRHPNVAGATEKVGGESSTRHKESDIEIKQETDYEELPDETLTVPQSPQEDAPPQLKEVDNKEKQFQSHQPAASTKALVIPRKQQQAEMTDQNDENEFGLNKFATTTTDPAPSTFHKPNLFGPPPTEDLIARYSNPNLNEDKRLRDGAQQDKEDRYESDFHSDDGAQPAASPPHTAQPLRDLPNPTARPVGSVTGVAATSQPFLSGTPFNHKVAVEPLVESRVYQQSPNEVASSYQAISKPKSPYFLGSSKAINGSPALNDMYVPSASSASTQFQSPRGSREALGKPLWLKG